MTKIGVMGCGWLGFPLAEYLVKKGFTISGTTTSSEKLPELKAAGIKPFLIRFPDQQEQLTAFLNLDILIINIPPGRKNPNVEEDYPNLIFALLKKLSAKTKILFISSTSVYGNANGEIKEHSARYPISNSGKALLRIEEFLEKKNEVTAQRRNRNTILRLSGLVGGNRHPGRFLAGRKELPNGDAPINLIHRKDCIQAIYEIIRQEVWEEDFNLSADKHPKKRDFYLAATEALGLLPPEFLAGGESGKWINNEKIKKQLGLKLIYPNPLDFLS